MESTGSCRQDPSLGHPSGERDQRPSPHSAGRHHSLKPQQINVPSPSLRPLTRAARPATRAAPRPHARLFTDSHWRTMGGLVRPCPSAGGPAEGLAVTTRSAGIARGCGAEGCGDPDGSSLPAASWQQFRPHRKVQWRWMARSGRLPAAPRDP